MAEIDRFTKACRGRSLACIALASSILGASTQSTAASFDCSTSRSVTEQAICETPDLSAADREMAAKYHKAYELSGDDRRAQNELLLKQRSWLASTHQCNDDVDCLRDYYQRRNNELDFIIRQIDNQSKSINTDQSQSNNFQSNIPATTDGNTTPEDNTVVSEPSREATVPSIVSTATENAPPKTADLQLKSGSSPNLLANILPLIGWGLLFIVGLNSYFLPFGIAHSRKSKYVNVILLLNCFVAWTGVLWIALLAWALWPKGDAVPVAIQAHAGESQTNFNSPTPLADENSPPVEQPSSAFATEVAPASFSRASNLPPQLSPMTRRTMKNPVSEFFGRYVDFKGRTSRKSFWYVVLMLVPVILILAVIGRALGGSGTSNHESPLAGLFYLAVFLPSTALSVRRLHDLNKSGWWSLLSLTVIGALVLLFWQCQPGNVGSNKFGPDPLQHT